jgi:hypothetical protein
MLTYLEWAWAQEHWMDPIANSHDENVPAVSPVHLRAVLIMAYEWSLDGMDDNDVPLGDETMTGDDLNALLDRIVRTCEVDSVGAVALFKRAIALSVLCAETELPGMLFEDGLPGRKHCGAAKVPVLIRTSDEEGKVSHYFDESAIREALLVARN